MELNFNQNTTIGDIKGQFSKYFKHVRLEFYHHSHKNRAASAKEDQILDHVTLGYLTGLKASAHTEFDQTVKISELEQIFERDFGLHIQVFREYGGSWLQTTLSDHWTLQMAEMEANDLERVKQENH